MPVLYTTADGLQFAASDETLLVLGYTLALELITDRTQADVDRWRELRDKLPDLTAAERAEWFGTMKGRYTHDDMNRVEGAVEYLCDEFLDRGYITEALDVKIDWNLWSVPTRTDMGRYLGNIAKLRGVLRLHDSTPAVPSVNDKLDWRKANDIEQILVDIEDMMLKIDQSWHYAGELYSGEV